MELGHGFFVVMWQDKGYFLIFYSFLIWEVTGEYQVLFYFYFQHFEDFLHLFYLCVADVYLNKKGFLSIQVCFTFHTFHLISIKAVVENITNGL